MKRAVLMTERSVTFMTQKPGGLAADNFNGVALADTETDAMSPDTGASGLGIDMSNYYRAKVAVLGGSVAGDNTIEAWVGPKGKAADDADYPAVKVDGFGLSVGSAQAGKVVVGELFTQAIKKPDGYPDVNSLWIKQAGSDNSLAVEVTLDDPALELQDGRNTLQENAVYTG